MDKGSKMGFFRKPMNTLKTMCKTSGHLCMLGFWVVTETEPIPAYFIKKVQVEAWVAWEQVESGLGIQPRCST